MANYQVLITGANRGIGLEFTKQYAQDGWNVIACCRDPQSATALLALANTHPNIRTFSLDVTDFAKIDALALQLKNESIDVLINNAGVYPDSSLGDADENEWLDAFKINSIAPLKMASAFTSHIAKSTLKKIAVLSSKMG
ncbi:MAG: SDR family NAD(P)-dependent oxidoreductase, partial [Methylotenera sp.]